MDLWIRSQDKECITMVNHLYTNDFGEIRQQDDLILGTYETKERALEVLDEIEKIIQPPMDFIVSQHINFDNDGEGLIGCNILKEEPKIEKISDVIIYQMPHE